MFRPNSTLREKEMWNEKGREWKREFEKKRER